MYLLDSDICIRLMRNRSPSLSRQLNPLGGRLFTSVIVRHELMNGALLSSQPVEQAAEVEDLLARLELLDFDAAAADHAADIKADLRRRGRMIGANDILIAGHARSLGLIVVTGNLREFERVDGLRCEDWPAGPPGPYLT